MNYIIQKSALEQAFLNISFKRSSQSNNPLCLIINFLIENNLKHGVSFPSQLSISQIAGVCRQTANRLIKKLCDLGIIKKVYRHRKTCIYTLTNQINKLSENSELRRLYPALKKIYYKIVSMRYLFSHAKPASDGHFESNATPYKNIYNFIYNSLTSIVRGKLKGESTATIVSQSFYKNRDEEMKNAENVMKNLAKVLNLTPHGECKLSVYDQKALSALYQRLQGSNMKLFKSPFYFAISFLNKYSIEHKLPVSWSFYRSMCFKLGVDTTTPYFIDNPANVSISQQPVKSVVHAKAIVPEYVYNPEYEAKQIEIVEEARQKGKMGKGFPFPYPGSMQ